MNFVLATLCGIIVTTMNVFNGQLSDYTGVYLSTVIIHSFSWFSYFFNYYEDQK